MKYKHKLLPEKWNREILTLADFDAYCETDGVLVFEVAAESAGCYMHVDGIPVIFLRNTLRGLNKVRVAMHELGHHWLHVPGPANYCHTNYGNISKAEHDANVVEACAMIPLPVLRNTERNEIAEMYGYPNELIAFRERVFRYYNF